MSPKYNHKYPYKREAEGDETQKRRRQYDYSGKGWSDVGTSKE